MGDFNAVYDPLTDRPPSSSKDPNNWKPEIKLFNFLDDWSFTDVHKLWNIDKPSSTWSNSISHSRIDYIWVSHDIAANNIHSFLNENIEIITNSDYSLLILKLYKKDLIGKTKSPPIRSKGTTIILDIKNTTPEQWAQYTEKVENKLSDGKILDLIIAIQQNCKRDQEIHDHNTNANRSKLQKA